MLAAGDYYPYSCHPEDIMMALTKIEKAISLLTSNVVDSTYSKENSKSWM